MLIKKQSKTNDFFFFFQSVLGEGYAWGGSNGWGFFGPGVWVRLGRIKAAEESGSFSKWLGSGLPVKVWKHCFWEQSSATLSWAPGGSLFSWQGHEIICTDPRYWRTPWRNQLLTKITSYHQMREGVLSQLKNTLESWNDLVGVSLIIWVINVLSPLPNACHFPNTYYSVSWTPFIPWGLSFMVQGKSCPSWFILSIFLNIRVSCNALEHSTSDGSFWKSRSSSGVLWFITRFSEVERIN